MGVLQRFERKLEGLVSGAFARAFKSEVQPVEIAGALQREADDKAAIVAAGRTLVPNDYVVELGQRDHDRLAAYEQALATELATMVSEHAAEQGYAFIGPVAVRFEQVEDLPTGVFRVRSDARAAARAAYADDTDAARLAAVRAGPEDDERARNRAAYGPRPVSAWLEIAGTRHHLIRPVTTLGRGTDADLRLDDPGVSRRHAEVRLQGETVEVVDLGSTNGTLVRGERVRHARLRDGDRLSLGSTDVVFRQPREGEPSGGGSGTRAGGGW